MYIVEPALGFVLIYVIVFIFYRTGIKVTLRLCILLFTAFLAVYRIFQAPCEKYLTTDFTGAEIEAPFRKPLMVIKEYWKK